MQFFKKNHMTSFTINKSFLNLKSSLKGSKFKNNTIIIDEKYYSGIIDGGTFSISFDFFPDESKTKFEINTYNNVPFGKPKKISKEFIDFIQNL